MNAVNEILLTKCAAAASGSHGYLFIYPLLSMHRVKDVADISAAFSRARDRFSML
jgi:hypothetical protein